VQFYDPDIGYENLWAEAVAGRLYRLESVPFFIYGVSRDDVVAVKPDVEGRLQFVEVKKQSGNRTLRARSDRFLRSSKFRNQVKTELSKLGADSEELRHRLLAINVPKGTDLIPITDYLTHTAKVSWEYGNPEGMNKPKAPQ